MQASKLRALQAALLEWFDMQGRDLPWRVGPEGGRDPYRTWVAEVLLQQTQVSRGRVYYERFLQAFPTVEALANAPQEAVLKAWEGCGYYARARNLHTAAKTVVASGFPTHYEGWLGLKGVGPYTAAAVASLAYGEARAVSDGNVRRVLSRLLGERQPTPAWVQARADELLPAHRPAAWNEAVMDLGATICTPKAPQCSVCPVQAFCAAYASGTAGGDGPTAFPAPKKRAKVQEVQAVALLLGTAEQALLEQRTGTLLGGLYGLPLEAMQAGETPTQALERLLERLGLSAHLGEATPLGTVQHTMTHRRLTVDVFGLSSRYAPRPLDTVADAALSRLDHKALALYSAPKLLP